MKPIWLYSLLCLTLLTCVTGASARGVVPYVYTTYRVPEGVSNISIGTSPSVVYVGHAGRGAKFCPRRDEFHCLESVVFDFAVPKGKLRDGMSWSRNGISYRVLSGDEVKIFGRAIAVHVIEEVVDQQRVAIFLYSQKNGLVGFLLLKGNDSPSMYFLSGKRGFPF